MLCSKLNLNIFGTISFNIALLTLAEKLSYKYYLIPGFSQPNWNAGIAGQMVVIHCVPQKGFGSARHYMHYLSIRPSVHKQLIGSFRTLFEVHFVLRPTAFLLIIQPIISSAKWYVNPKAGRWFWFFDQWDQLLVSAGIPGQMALTLILRPIRSAAKLLVNPITAALVVPYANLDA